jgi:quinol monooxygenase YgiN
MDKDEMGPSQIFKGSSSRPMSGITNNNNDDMELDGRKCTFVAIADIELRRDCIAQFRKWFSEVNNQILSKYKGFIRRILIESPDGRHKIIFMIADKESFLAIRASQQHKELHEKALTFMTKPPAISFYEIAAI